MFDYVKHVEGWTTLTYHVYDSFYYEVMKIVICNMQFENTKVQCVMWQNLNNVMANNGVSNPNFKGFMVDNVQANWNDVRIIYGSGEVNQWLTKNNYYFSTGVNPWTNTQNNILSQSCEKNIGHCVMNTKMPFLWKHQMLNMQQFNVGGIHWGQLMKLDFKSWTISSIFGIFV